MSVLSPVVTETGPSTLTNAGGSPTKAERLSDKNILLWLSFHLIQLSSVWWMKLKTWRSLSRTVSPSWASWSPSQPSSSLFFRDRLSHTTSGRHSSGRSESKGPVPPILDNVLFPLYLCPFWRHTTYLYLTYLYHYLPLEGLGEWLQNKKLPRSFF